MSEVYRYFNNRNLVSKETYYQDGQAVLDIRYRYDSSGQLILKNINEISIFYLRDKDGNIIHKIVNDLNSGETFDWVVYNPSMLNFDTDGFELIRYTGKREGMKKETLLFKDFEGNIRLVIDMFDRPKIDESYIQRTVASDGDYLPEHEFILNYLVERAQNRKPDPHGLYNRLYDIYSQAQDISEEEDAISIKSAYAGEDDCCYYYGWCPPECSNCNDCGGGGGGGGEGGGGSGGGGGGGGSSWNEDCAAVIFGPMLVYTNSVETYNLVTMCENPREIIWYGGYGLNNGGFSYSTFWVYPGSYYVSVHFTISDMVEIIVDPDSDPTTPNDTISYEIIVISKSSYFGVDVIDQNTPEPPPLPPPDSQNLSIRIINTSSPSGNGSFVARRGGGGDTIQALAEAFYGNIDLSNQIVWSGLDYPSDGIDSGTVSPSTSTGYIYSFIPSPPAAPNGRQAPLKYIIKAEITYYGIIKEASVIVSQDNLDELRQQYEGFTACRPMPRSAFDTDPAAFTALLGTAAQTSRFQYHILRSLNQHAIAANNNFLLAHDTNIRFTSGYRTPQGNAATQNSSATSNHQYGQAFDFAFPNNSQMNYDAYTAARQAGAAADTYLKVKSENGYRKIFWYQIPPQPSDLPEGEYYVQGHAVWAGQNEYQPPSPPPFPPLPELPDGEI
ncbi:MAG: hypothetical protein PHQ25_07300 [Acidobacteriota bacterium]|nr:hypothetical protein [Acidobacteriota bacterium]